MIIIAPCGAGYCSKSICFMFYNTAIKPFVVPYKSFVGVRAAKRNLLKNTIYS